MKNFLPPNKTSRRLIPHTALFLTVLFLFSVCFTSYGSSELPGIVYASSDENADSDNTSSMNDSSSGASLTQSSDEASNDTASSGPGAYSVSPSYCRALNERYYISRLSESLYKNFLALYTSVQNFESVCVFPENITENDVEILVRILHLDCPELFQIEASASYTVSMRNNRIVSVSIPYSLDKDNYEKMLNSCHEAVSSIKSSIPDGLSDYEKELRAYDALASTCTYNELVPFSGSAYGALVLHNAKCDGISLAMKWILDELGIENLVISGKADGAEAGHAWNVVKIDGNFYDLDMISDMQKEGVYSPLYYAVNVSDSWIRSRYPVSESLKNYFSIPGAADMSGSYHARNGSFFGAGTDASSIQSYFYSNADRINRHSSSNIFMQFENDADFSSFKENFRGILSDWSSSRSKSIETSSSYSPDYRTIRMHINIK